MITALFVHDVILEPNPAWWPLLYPADLLIGFYLSRVFGARMMAWDDRKNTDFDEMPSDERAAVGTVSVIGGIFWPIGLAAWGAIKLFSGVPMYWKRSVNSRAQRIIAKRSEEKPTLGRLESLDQREIA